MTKTKPTLVYSIEEVMVALRKKLTSLWYAVCFQHKVVKRFAFSIFFLCGRKKCPHLRLYFYFSKILTNSPKAFG